MEKYDYLSAVKADVAEYITEHEAEIVELIASEGADIDYLYDTLYDDMFISDSITGNASGSYTFNTWQAEENIAHNLDLLADAIEYFGDSAEYLKKGAEAADVTIRCYLLSEALSDTLSDMYSDLAERAEAEAEDTED